MMKKKLLLLTLLTALCLRASALDGVVIKPSVAPLLKTAWSQKDPYNRKCPVKIRNGEEVHCVVGCTACALGQILNFHQYPERGKGEKSYWFLVNVSADFEHTYYQWDKMLPTYSRWISYTDEQADAVAQLLADVGCAMGSIYGVESTGAITNISGVVPKSLESYFRYDASDMRHLKRDDYTDEQWMDTIRTYLSAGLPIFMTAISPTQGAHAFVLDGYNEAGKVHINWGWNGLDNDYYDIDLKNTANDFSEQQQLVVGIRPPKNAVPTAIPAIAQDPAAPSAIYGPDGRLRQQLEKGLNIVRLPDGTTRKIIK